MARRTPPGPPPQIPLDDFVARRAALAAKLGRRTILVSSHAEALYANDVYHRFRPQSDFWYLTGFAEPGALLMLEGGSGRTTLWLREREPRAEVWNGHRLGLDAAPDTLGVDKALPIDALSRTIDREVTRKGVLGIMEDPSVNLRVKRVLGPVDNGKPLVASMRVRKDATELRMLRRAAKEGGDAMAAGARAIHSGNERHVEAALLAHYANAGTTGAGYPPIVGAGENASILHYVDNRAPIEPGDLVLVDAGCGWGYYTSDITRTFCAGKMNQMKAALYDIVHEASRKAIAAVRPGASLYAPHMQACKTITEGLVGLGILQGDVEQLVEEKAYAPFFMHGTSHFLGLDVHDAGKTRGKGKPIKLEEGMVLTVEPGLYFNPNYADCPRGTKGIGIRIEDDIVVTSSGRTNLTAAVPKKRDAVER